MDLLTYIAEGDRKSKLAAGTGCSEGYLWQIATGWRGKRPSPELAQAIERESNRIGPEAVPKESLRPDLWMVVGDPGLHQHQDAKAGGTAETTPNSPLSKVA